MTVVPALWRLRQENSCVQLELFSEILSQKQTKETKNTFQRKRLGIHYVYILNRHGTKLTVSHPITEVIINLKIKVKLTAF